VQAHNRSRVVNLSLPVQSDTWSSKAELAQPWDDKIIRRPSMTSPQAFRGASCPFLQQLTYRSLCSRSRCLLIPRRLERRRKECSRPRASEPCPEKQKRGSSCPQAPHRSSQLQLRACRFFPRRQITGCTADAASCWAGKRC